MSAVTGQPQAAPCCGGVFQRLADNGVVRTVPEVPEVRRQKQHLPCSGAGRVGIQMSKVEVRFEDLRVDADVHVGGRAMPTVLNSVRNFVEVGVHALQAMMEPVNIKADAPRELLRCVLWRCSCMAGNSEIPC